MKIDHIGYAVKDISKAQKKFLALGFTFEPIISDDDRGIEISFGDHGDSYRIELVSPMKGKASPVSGILSKNGSIPYHICYQSSEFDEDIDRLKNIGFKVMLPPANAVAFGGKKVVFLYAPAIGLTEIVET